MPLTPSARDMSDGPTATMSIPSIDEIASMSSTAGRSSIINRQRHLAVGLLDVLLHAGLAVVGGARGAGHPAFAQRWIAHGLHRLARRPRVGDVRHLDALHA